jgi:alginate production protein
MKLRLLALCVATWAGLAQAQWQPVLRLSADSLQSDDTHPGSGRDAYYLEGQLRWDGQLTEQQSAHMDVRGFLSDKELDLRDEEVGRTASSQTDRYLALRQLWWRYQPLGLTPFPGESMTVGLQRQQSEDGNWWDADIESLSWRLETTTTHAMVSVGERFDTYRSGNNQLDAYDDNKLRLFGELSQDWRPYQALTGRFMYATQNGQQASDFSTGDPQGVNGDWLWLGLGTASEWFVRRQENQPLAYHLEWTWLQGQSDFLPTSGGGSRSYDIQAWSLDSGVRYDFKLPQRLAVGLQYAYGSGGADADSSNMFVQTGLNSNRQHFLGNRQYLSRFNDVLRADLGNLQQWSLFSAMEPLTDVEMGLAWSWYQRNDNSLPVYSAGRALPVEAGGSSNLGQGVDLVASWYFHSVLDNPQEGRLRLRGSGFDSGSAFIEHSGWDQRWVLDVMLNF